ncbi:hypothetical protein ACFQL7_20820 [Halocatena marina]|uniref:DUF2634 domain-containing protein n=1 Tax=Halocatena marina TaxID=2934937 RepID=A0ABD5YWI8_9EURY|nr:hypothetical protein [Halocatena marina]
MDIKVNEKFDIIFGDRNDLEIVEGRAEFEQRIAVRTIAYYHEVIGKNLSNEEILGLIELQAQRVAADQPELDSLASITAEFAPNKPNTVNLTLTYDNGDEVDFTFSE